MCVSTFLLVFFDSLAGKAFLVRSIKLCLVDNQRSSGVAVAGFETCWFEAGSSTSRSPPIERTLTSRKIGPSPHQAFSSVSVAFYRYSDLFSSSLYWCVEYFLFCSNPKDFSIDGTDKDPIFDSLKSIAMLPSSPPKNDDQLDDSAV